MRYKSLVVYVIIMTLLIWGALIIVAQIARAKVPAVEVIIVLWFTIGWRLAWTIWVRTVGRLGQKWVRWGRMRRRGGLRAPFIIRLIPICRATLTVIIFIPLFLSTVLTHRCKLTDGQDPQSIFNMKYESIRIRTNDGLTLDGWFIGEENAERTIIICHGAGANKGNFVWFLGPLAYKGYNVVFFDFRAHGGSSGRTTTYGIHEKTDVIAVVNWLKRERSDQSRLIIGLGSSLGSMALILAAAEDPRIDAVILDSPFASHGELAMHHARRLPIIGPFLTNILLAAMSVQTGANFFTVSAEKAISEIGLRPVLIIHGQDDFVMPKSHSRRLYDAAKGPHEIWFGPGPHSNIVTTDPDGYTKHLFDFLNIHFGPAYKRGQHQDQN
ncbi:MAG: alpha/beta fold hydrolase [Planctomycetota bacterium]|nr:MAG: alpha/beta fold hydrolase [Planctomycetota bacterium]